MGLTVTSRSSRWCLYVFFLVTLLNTRVSSEEPTPTNEKYWSNVTTGPGQFYTSSEETSRTPNTTLETHRGNVTTGPDQVYTTREGRSKTPNTTLEAHWSNVTTGPDQIYTSSKETSGTPNSTTEKYWSNATTGPDQIYTSSEETSGTPNSTTEKYWGNVTTGPDQVYTTREERSITPNTTPETHGGNVTTGPDRLHITREERSRAPNTSLETHEDNVTTGPDGVYTTTEVTSRTPNTTGTLNNSVVTHTGNVTSGPELTSMLHVTMEPSLGFTSEDTLNTTYQRNVTTGPDTEASSRTPNTTIETYTGNATVGSDYNHEETSRTPNSTLDLVYIPEGTSGTPNTTKEEHPSNVTTGPDLGYISEETTGTPDSTLEMTRTFYTDLNYTTHGELTTRTPNTTPQGDGASSFSVVYCLQDADCPPFTMCTELGGHHMCQCHLGYYFHHELGCVQARTFLARIAASVLFWDQRSVTSADEIRHSEAAHLQGVHRVALLFQNLLGDLPGYLSTSMAQLQSDEGLVTIVHSFSTLSPVSEDDLWGALSASPLLCTEAHPLCASPLTSDSYQALSLCDLDMCEPSSSTCHSQGGLVSCDCRGGYYKASPTDRTCTACESGFQRTEHGCERCPIGFGGFNCEESYLLVVIVESCVGCVLLVSLVTLFVFYLRRKEPQKPTFIDNFVVRVPTDQPSLRLPRAQLSWRREWEWNEPPEKVLTDIQQEAATPEGPAIHMKTFGVPARFSAPSTYHGHHNLSFISD